MIRADREKVGMVSVLGKQFLSVDTDLACLQGLTYSFNLSHCHTPHPSGHLKDSRVCDHCIWQITLVFVRGTKVSNSSEQIHPICFLIRVGKNACGSAHWVPILLDTASSLHWWEVGSYQKRGLPWSRFSGTHNPRWHGELQCGFLACRVSAYLSGSIEQEKPSSGTTFKHDTDDSGWLCGLPQQEAPMKDPSGIPKIA